MYTLHTILSSNFLDAQQPSYFSADFMIFPNRYKIESKWCQKSKSGSFMCIAFQFVAPLKGHILPNLSLKRRGCLWPTKRDPYHWLRQSLKRPRSACVFWSRLRSSHDFLVALFAIWRASHASDRENGGRNERVSKYLCKIWFCIKGSRLFILYEFHEPLSYAQGANESRVYVNRNESDWVLVDVITQQPSLPGIFAL